ncbi:MAG: hypothetical protein ACFFAS_17190 [Promethearchaeota archaeon]
MLEQIEKNNHQKIQFFIDFDKTSTILYDNIYLEEIDFVVKLPMVKEHAFILSSDEAIIIEKFNLSNQIFLLSYA